MAFADSDRKTLEGLTTSIKKWTDIFLNDPACTVLGLRDGFLREDLMELRRIRWFSVHTEPELEKLWLRYVDRDIEDTEVKASMFDYVMTGCTYMMLHNPMSEADYNSFIDHLAGALTWPSRAILVPVDHKQYSAPASTFTGILKTNYWMVFLILLAMSDIEQ
jgi:hypothetical protein